MSKSYPRQFTGWHAATILIAFFGVVIAVNVIMARYAISTFGGVVVENSYVASQNYNRWLDEARAQKALGWHAVTTWRPDNRLVVALKGAPDNAVVTADARHPLGRTPDQALSFAAIGNGQYLSDQVLPDGRWTLRIEVQADDNIWRQEEALR